MTDLSADLARADSEARESRERERFETEAWLIRMSDGTRFIHGHNAIGDYRAIDPGATVVELVPRAALAPAVPPGFVLVPVEPTNAMWDAAVLEENRISRDFPGQHPSCFQIWKSMVSAAPSAKEPTCPKN